jgi:tetratricopeptide (TPR) repeat protein
MYAGNLAEAQKAIQAYARLRPDDANALDSLGDVNFYLGEFAEAEKRYLEASVKNANFAGGAALGKAAQARLMTGDVAGASEIFNRYLDNRRNAKDPLVEYRRAEWEYRTGRRRQAVDRMESFARAAVSSPSPDVASAAYCQLAIWELALGDRSRARNFAMKAASTPRAGGAAAVAAYLTGEPGSAAEWSERASRMFPASGQQRAKNLTLAYALLLAREFQAAASTLQDVYQHSAPDPGEQVPVLLAWALEETGKSELAAPLLARNPVPNTGADVFSSLSFPRLFFLRAALAERQNKPDEAARNYRQFLTLSGPDAEIFGQEERARQLLAGSKKP